jgi:replicative DNA helicase
VNSRLESEKIILGSVLLYGDAQYVEYALLRLTDESFAEPRHRKIFQTIKSIHEQNQAPDASTVMAQFSYATEFHTTIAMLCKEHMPFVNFKQACDRLVNEQLKSRLSEILATTQTNLRGAGVDVAAAIESTEAELAEINKTAVTAQDFLPVQAYAVETLRRIEKARKRQGGLLGLSSGLGRLDYSLQGLQKGHVIIVAARPGVGKTTIALQIALALAFASKRVLFVTLEMSGEELTGKLIANAANLDHGEMKRGNVSDSEMARASRAERDISATRLMIKSHGGETFAQIRAAIRRTHFQEPIDAVIVDYIGLIRSYDGKDQKNPRHQIVSDCSRGFKLLAQQLQVPMIVLSQLNRGVEQRGNSVPGLSDLRESGSLEQDADAVILLHREKDSTGVMETKTKLLLAKNRHGNTASIELEMMPALCRFEEVRR